MSRTTKNILATLVCLTVAFFSQTARAGWFNSGSFASPTDLGLNSLDPVVAGQAIHAGASPEGSHTVGNVTFLDRSNDTTGLLSAGGFHTWAAPTFSDPLLSATVDSVRVLHSQSNNSASGTISGLISGRQYQLQLIIYDGDFGRAAGDATINAGSDTFNYSIVTPTSTALGRYINYNFFATGSTLAVSITPIDATPGTANDVEGNITFVLSAFDVRLVPEPATAGLMLLGGIGVASARRLSRGRRLLMTRTVKNFVAICFCLLGMLFPRLATAGTFTVSSFTGPGAGGLDLDGNLVIRENTAGGAVTVAGVSFTAGDTYFTGGSPYTGWPDPTFADSGLNSVVDSVSLKLATGTPQLSANLPVLNANPYRLQLIFREGDSGEYNGGGRPNWVIQAGSDTLSGFNVTTAMGGGTYASHTGVGALVTYDFSSTGTSLLVTLSGNTGTNQYVYLNAFTLERVPEPASGSLLLMGACGVAVARRAARNQRRRSLA